MNFNKEVDELRGNVNDLEIPYVRQTLEPSVVVRRVRRNKHTISALFIGLLFAIGVYFIIPYYNFNIQESFILGLSVIAIYAIILFFLLEPGIEKEIKQRTIERYKEPANDIIKEIGFPVDRPVFIEVERAKKKLNIPKYNFLGSSKTRVYHNRNCRLGKMIKRKYKVSDNRKRYFRNRGYKACKICLSKNKGKKK